MTDKLIKNGKVAVLISPGYGAGWSTWCRDPDTAQKMLFDPVIAQMLFDGREYAEIEPVAEERYPDEYLGGLRGLIAFWVPVGSQFRINEYDGSESLIFNHEENWNVA